MTNFWYNLKKPIIALAPMAGITDSGFRLLCKGFGADVVYTEMTSIDALYYHSRKTLAMLKFDKKEKPIILQLFGKRPELVEKAIKVAEESGFDGIDLNFGCPAPKVVRHEGGIRLLKNLNLCRELVQAVCETTKLPVSVKTRVSIGTGKERITVFDFLEKIKNQPVSALMLHGRTFEQGFTGGVDYETMRSVKKFFKGIVIGNGGINAPEDAKKMIDSTGVDGVGLARGLYGRPWLFKLIKDFIKNGKYKTPTLNQIKKTALKHAELNYKAKSEHGIVELRKHLCWYFRGFPGAASLRTELVRVDTIEDVRRALEKI